MSSEVDEIIEDLNKIEELTRESQRVVQKLCAKIKRLSDTSYGRKDISDNIFLVKSSSLGKYSCLSPSYHKNQYKLIADILGRTRPESVGNKIEQMVEKGSIITTDNQVVALRPDVVCMVRKFRRV